jgi:hypothetical protein
MSPNATWVFVNSSVASFDSETGRGWWGQVGTDARHAQGISETEYIAVPVWQNVTLNAPSKKNTSLPAWKDQDVGDLVQFNTEFLRLFTLMMEPVVKNFRAKGWINRTFAFLGDEAPWPCFTTGFNFTVNAWVKLARCTFFDRNLHSMMPLDPTPARLKRICK